MYDLLIAFGLILLGVYVFIGAAAAIALHRNGLVVLDPAVRDTGFFFRAGITPGLVALWPVLLLRWRRAARGSEPRRAACAPSVWQQRAVFAAAALTAITAVGLALILREPSLSADRPDVSIPAPQDFYVRRSPGPILGNIFPSIPARFQVARDHLKVPGILMEVEEGATVAPTSIYWNEQVDEQNAIPEGAVHVATVWGSQEQWFPFTVPDMWKRGYWIAYSHVHQRSEVYRTIPESTAP